MYRGDSFPLFWPKWTTPRTGKPWVAHDLQPWILDPCDGCPHSSCIWSAPSSSSLVRSESSHESLRSYRVQVVDSLQLRPNITVICIVYHIKLQMAPFLCYCGNYCYKWTQSMVGTFSTYSQNRWRMHATYFPLFGWLASFVHQSEDEKLSSSLIKSL